MQDYYWQKSFADAVSFKTSYVSWTFVHDSLFTNCQGLSLQLISNLKIVKQRSGISTTTNLWPKERTAWRLAKGIRRLLNTKAKAGKTLALDLKGF